MAPLDPVDRPRVRSYLIAVMLITFGICGLTLATSYFYDSACRSGASNWLPVYPNAQLVEETYSFLTMHGIGTTEREFFTEDYYLDVRAWYQEQNTIAGRENKSRGGSAMRYRATEIESGGTRILLFSECAKELDLSEFGIGGVTRQGETS